MPVEVNFIKLSGGTVIPSQEFLREALDYSPESGRCVWRERPLHHFRNSHVANNWNSKYPGCEAGWRRGDGYVDVSFGANTGFRLHRVIFKYMTGESPEFVDHINHVRSDNRWSNLRAATKTDNTRNASRNKRNTSGVTGVYFHKQRQAWVAQISVLGRNCHLGVFETKELAISARSSAQVAAGYHPNHGS